MFDLPNPAARMAQTQAHMTATVVSRRVHGKSVALIG